MENSSVSKIGTWYVSSTHYRGRNGNVAIVKETHGFEDKDGNRTYIPKLKLWRDPPRRFWITKPEFRDHEYKKEFELISKCDEYSCGDSELEYTLKNALGIQWKQNFPTYRILDNPYVYGADIDAEVILKYNYKQSAPSFDPVYTKGGLDIETELVGDKRINLITFIHDHTIYSAGLEAFCKVYENGENSKPRKATMKDIEAEVQKWIGDLISEYGFKLNLKICGTEYELIKWIFDRIHECKTDFIGVWNINFDIPYILNRLKQLGIDAAAVMCHPDIPKEYRFVKYIEDTHKVDHFTDKWSWLYLPGYSQFLDAMCLYARLRKVYGRDSSYALDKIADKELGLRKLHFDGIEHMNHRIEQEYHFLRYWAYNINDVLLMQLMEFQNDDYGTLASLADVSLLSQFNHMTVCLKNDAFVEGLAHGKVPAAIGSRGGFTEYDKRRSKIGGTVLPPNKAENTSVHAVSSRRSQNTQVSVLTNDLDVSSFYPSNTEEFNISRESMLGTILGITGKPQDTIDHFASCIVQPDVTAMDIATTYYNMPDYEGALKIFEEEFLNKSRAKSMKS